MERLNFTKLFCFWRVLPVSNRPPKKLLILWEASCKGDLLIYKLRSWCPSCVSATEKKMKLFSCTRVTNTFRDILKTVGNGKQKSSGITSTTPQKEWNQFSWTKVPDPPCSVTTTHRPKRGLIPSPVILICSTALVLICSRLGLGCAGDDTWRIRSCDLHQIHYWAVLLELNCCRRQGFPGSRKR